MMHFNTRKHLLALATLLAAACSDAPEATYLHERADLGAIQTVAVLPFGNMTENRAAADKVHGIFLIELLSTGAFDVVEPGQVAKALEEGRIAATDKLTPEEFQALGRELGVDGLFLGTVVDFGEVRSGTALAPEISIQLRLVEVLSGVTVWSTSDTRSGATLSRQLIGVGGQSLTEAAHELVRRELATLFR